MDPSRDPADADPLGPDSTRGLYFAAAVCVLLAAYLLYHVYLALAGD